jgi:hypothetical protein
MSTADIYDFLGFGRRGMVETIFDFKLSFIGIDSTCDIT